MNNESENTQPIDGIEVTTTESAPSGTIIEVDEPVLMKRVKPLLITLTHINSSDTIEVTPAQWDENRARFELDGWRKPDEERQALTPPGETYQHSTGTGFVRN